MFAPLMVIFAMLLLFTLTLFAFDAATILLPYATLTPPLQIFSMIAAAAARLCLRRFASRQLTPSRFCRYCHAVDFRSRHFSATLRHYFAMPLSPRQLRFTQKRTSRICRCLMLTRYFRR